MEAGIEVRYRLVGPKNDLRKLDIVVFGDRRSSEVKINVQGIWQRTDTIFYIDQTNIQRLLTIWNELWPDAPCYRQKRQVDCEDLIRMKMRQLGELQRDDTYRSFIRGESFQQMLESFTAFYTGYIDAQKKARERGVIVAKVYAFRPDQVWTTDSAILSYLDKMRDFSADLKTISTKLLGEEFKRDYYLFGKRALVFVTEGTEPGKFLAETTTDEREILKYTNAWEGPNCWASSLAQAYPPPEDPPPAIPQGQQNAPITPKTTPARKKK
jgi:hypothetical protein